MLGQFDTAVSEEDFVNLYCECLCLLNTLSGHTRHAVPCLGVLAYEHSPIQEVVIYTELVCKLSIHRKKTSCATCFVCCRSVQCCTDVGHAGVAWLLTFNIYCALPCFCLKSEDLSNTIAAHFRVWSWGSWTRFVRARAPLLLHLICTLPEYTETMRPFFQEVSITDGQSFLYPGQTPAMKTP